MLDFETLTKLETCLKNTGFEYDFSIDDTLFLIVHMGNTNL